MEASGLKDSSAADVEKQEAPSSTSTDHDDVKDGPVHGTMMKPRGVDDAEE